MSKAIGLFTACFLFLSFSGFSQTITISGFVTDETSGEKLPGANVFLPSIKKGTRSNNYGFYSLTVDKGTSDKLVISYTGYDRLEKTVTLSKNLELNIALKQSNSELKKVVVKASSADKIEESTQMSSVKLQMKDIKKLPAFLGEVDILKAIQLLPGIQAGSEGQSGIYVRGGGPDQNLMLLDGIPVYNASHLFGFFSVFNADAVQSVEVYKGGFPARYGGRLSSVIDIRMKEGSKDKIHGKLGIGLIASRLMLEGPFGKNKKGSWMVSGRRTYIDVLTTPIVLAASNGQGTGGYFFHDVNAKANYSLGKKDKVYLSTYLGKDKFFARFNNQFNNTEEAFRSNIKWGNITALARWNHVYSPKVFGNLSLTYSKYEFNVGARTSFKLSADSTQTTSASYSSYIRDYAAKYDFDIIPNPNHYIKAGISGVMHRFVPGAVNVSGNIDPNSNIDTAFNVENVPELDAYIEDDIEITKNFKANIGLHASAFITDNNFYKSLQPRISARYLLGRQSSIKASYAQMAQFIHLLTNNGVGLPTDLWVPVTDKIKPQQSHQVAVGYSKRIKNNYEFSVEGYYKTMQNIIEYKDGSSFLNTNQSWEDKVEMGKGWSYGGEVFLQKKEGRLTGLVGYTLSWTNRKFPTINFGNIFPYKYDRRHDFKIAAVYKVNKKVELSGNWIYGTGNSVTLPTARINPSAGYITGVGHQFDNLFYYSARNDGRMKAFHRLDLAINMIKKLRKGRERTWIISVYNAYSRKNPFFLYNQYNYRTDSYDFFQISLFPILPSFSYNLTF